MSASGVKQVKNAVARVAVSMLLAVGLAGCEVRSEDEDAALPSLPEVDVAVVQAEEVVLWSSFTGRVAAPETVVLRPRVTGYVEKVSFVEGELVSEGDVLFEIDSRPYRARHLLAQAQLTQEQSRFELARSQASRAEKLWEDKAISREEYDQRQAALSSARAAVSAALANLESATLELEYTTIRAPISGRIGRAEVTQGNLATADTTVLTSLVSVDPLYVYFESDQAAAQSNPFNHHDVAVPVRIELAQEDSNYLQGEIDFISNQYDASTGTLSYRARFSNPDNQIWPGQFARVEMPVSVARQAITIDEKALLTDQDRRYVYVLDSDRTVTRRYVDVGRRYRGLRVVENGLQSGEQVVVNGMQKILFQGMQVAPQLVDIPGTEKHGNEPYLADIDLPKDPPQVVAPRRFHKM